MNVGEDALDFLEIGLAAGIEQHVPMAAVEQLRVEMLFKRAHTVGDGGGGDAHFLRGAREALIARGRLEEAQAFERG